MIASLTGTVASTLPNVVLVVGGVGLLVQTTPGTPKPPVHHKGKGPSVKLVESVTTRRVLTGPATTSSTGRLLNNLPPLVETTTGGANAINTK